MHSFTKSRDSRMIALTATSRARGAQQKPAGGSASEEVKLPDKSSSQKPQTENLINVVKRDAHCQTPDVLPRAAWLAGPGPIDCVIVRLPNTELFAHRVTSIIQKHGIRTSDMVVKKKTEIAPCLESLRRSRESLYAVIIDDSTQLEELIGVQYLIKKDNVLRYIEYKEAVQQIGGDFAKLKDTPWNRQRIMKFFLDPMLDAIEPTWEDFNYFKNYLKRGLRS